MELKSKIQNIFVVILFTLLFISLTGCVQLLASAPSATPTAPQELTTFHLPDGSDLIVKGEPEIGIARLSGATASDSLVSIDSGEMLVVSHLPAGVWFTVTNSKGFMAHVTANNATPGAIMRVAYDPSSGVFSIDCVLGICEIGPNAQTLSVVPLNNQGSLDQGGGFQGASTYDGDIVNGTYGTYIRSGEPVSTYTPLATATETSTPIPTATVTPSVDIAASATASCSQFHSQYPSTPCP